MKKIAAVVALLACSIAWADFFKVTVSAVGPNTYRTTEGATIRTRSCSETPIGEDAVLRYSNDGRDWLAFDDRTICEVVEVFK